MNREIRNIEESQRPEQPQTQKVEKEERQEGARFNQEVASFLTQEFDESGDVRGAFMTHTFPIENIGGIVKEGGLRTGKFLEKQRTQFKQGSSFPWGSGAQSGEIMFGKGTIHDQYSGEAGVENVAVLLFPIQEFRRMERLRHEGGSGDQFDINDTKRSGPGAEYSIKSEKISVDYIGRATDRIATQKTKREIERSNDFYRKERGKIEKSFSEQISHLDIHPIPKDAALVLKQISWNTELAGITLDAQKTIETIRTALPNKQSELAIASESLSRHELNLTPQLKALTPGLRERMGLGGGETRRAKKAELERQLEEQRVKAATAQKTFETMERDLRLAEQRLKDAKLFKKMHEEYRNLIWKADQERLLRFKKIETSEGASTAKIKERLRRLHETEKVEERVQADLSHAIVLVEKRHVEQVREAVKDKPGLASRVIVYDGDQFKRGNWLTKLNPAFDRVSQTREGLALLTAAQIGSSKKTHSAVDGVWRLEDYEAKEDYQQAA